MLTIDDILGISEELASTISAVRKLAYDSYKVDISGVYCLHTGKEIGSFNDDEIHAALRDEASSDIEELMDAMLVRIVASMRPSPALNKPDLQTIRMMVDNRPLDAMAYLVNRLEGSRQLITKRHDSAFSALLSRITNYSSLRLLKENGFDFRPWLHWLLELDSKRNLHDLEPPLFEKDRLGKWLTTKNSQTSVSLVEALTLPGEGLLAAFESWVFDQLSRYNVRDAQVTRESNWVRGNALTRQAYAQSWLSNPNLTRKVEIANNKRQAEYNKSQKPGRPKSEKTRKMDERVDAILNKFANVFDGKAPALVNPKPKPVPVLRLNLTLMATRLKKD